jgi:hypothetical protein
LFADRIQLLDFCVFIAFGLSEWNSRELEIT